MGKELTPVLDPKDKAEIDAMTLVQLLRKYRHTPIGDHYFSGDRARATYYMDRIFAMRDADPEAWTRASKEVGW